MNTGDLLKRMTSYMKSTVFSQYFDFEKKSYYTSCGQIVDDLDKEYCEQAMRIISEAQKAFDELDDRFVKEHNDPDHYFLAEIFKDHVESVIQKEEDTIRVPKPEYSEMDLLEFLRLLSEPQLEGLKHLLPIQVIRSI